MPAMHPGARKAVKDLSARGITLDPVDDFHHLVELDRLARVAAGISADWKARAVMFPTLCTGRVILRRLSLGARLFFNDSVLHWDLGGDPDIMRMLALAWLMAHGDDPAHKILPFTGSRDRFLAELDAWQRTIGVPLEALDAAVAALLAHPDPAPPANYDRARCVEALRVWQRSRGAPADALEAVIASLSALPEPAPPDEPDLDYGEIAAALWREGGQTAFYWFWGAPEAETALMLDKRNERIDRENRQITSSGGRIVAPSPDAAWVRARHALRVYMEQIAAEKIRLKETNRSPARPEQPAQLDAIGKSHRKKQSSEPAEHTAMPTCTIQ